MPIMYSYTYQLVHVKTGHFYIGSRYSDLPPEKDLFIRYFSSSNEVKKMGYANFYYGVIKQHYKTHQECCLHEKSLMREWIRKRGRSLCLNKSSNTRTNAGLKMTPEQIKRSIEGKRKALNPSLR